MHEGNLKVVWRWQPVLLLLPFQISQELRDFLASSSKLQALRNIDPKLFSNPEIGFKLLNSFLYEVANMTARFCPDNPANMPAKRYFQVFFDSFWLLLPEFNKFHVDGVRIFDGKNTHSVRSYVRCTLQRRFILACKKYNKNFLPASQENSAYFF